MKCWYLFLSTLFVPIIRGITLPSRFKKCNIHQPDITECLKDAVENGIKQLVTPIPAVGLPRIDPLELEELSITGGNGPINLQQSYKDVKYYGMSNIKITAVRFDFEKKTAFLEGFVPEIRMEAKYKVSGKILLFPVYGSGNSNITVTNTILSSNTTFEFVEKKAGHKHLNFLSCKVSLEPERSYIHFENLLNGDKMLGENINKVVNENWKEAFEDVRSGFEEAYAMIFRRFLNAFFSRVSYSEAFE